MSAVDCRTYGGPYVLACRCGRALRLSDMHTIRPPRDTVTDSVVINRVGCLSCAAQVEES